MSAPIIACLTVRQTGGLHQTFYFTLLSVALELVLGLLFAVLLNERFRGNLGARLAMIFPWALLTVSNGVLWAWILNPTYYVMGVGDEVPQVLEQIGVNVTMLGANDLTNGSLDQFDAIIIGIRVSAVRDDLKTYSKRLLDYTERGGNLIYQYQTQEFDAAPYGSYPYKLTARAEEISEEDAQVTILDASHPVFHWPNQITAADFHGWVVERGSKWMTTWDELYTPLLESHDRQPPPQQGGLLYAQYGKGTFVYAAYAFYRQLPAGVQGGYRLFANLISLKKRPR